MKCIFLNEKVRFLTKTSLKFVPKGPNDNNPALVTVVYIMAWRRISDKPLSEPLLTWFTDAYICSTRGRWVKKLVVWPRKIGNIELMVKLQVFTYIHDQLVPPMALVPRMWTCVVHRQFTTELDNLLSSWGQTSGQHCRAIYGCFTIRVHICILECYKHFPKRGKVLIQ